MHFTLNTFYFSVIILLISACGGSSPSETVTNVDPITWVNSQDCNKASYPTKPNAVSSDSAYRYYEYHWQSDPQLCIQFYEKDLLEDEWETRISAALLYATENLPNIVPVNAYVVDQKNALQTTLTQISKDVCLVFRTPDGSDLDNCIARADPWGNRSAAAGVSDITLPQGAELHFFRDVWTGHDTPERQVSHGVKVLMHEYYHTYQNSMKFYFEDTKKFGIRVQWEDDRASFLGEQDFVTVFPGWLEEGGAEFGGWALASKFDKTVDQRTGMIAHMDEARSVINTAAGKGDTVSLKDYEYKGGLYESSNNPNNGEAREFAYAYTGGFMAHVYLWSLDDANYKKLIVDYYINYAEKDKLNPGQGWKDSFEDLFGMSMEKFYSDFDAFMLKDRNAHLTALKSMDLWRSASWE